MNMQPCAWQRVLETPYLSPSPGSVAPVAVTTPDLLVVGERAWLYTGAVEAGRERLIYVPIDLDELEKPATWRLAAAQVVLDIGPQSFDTEHVFDPAVVMWQRRFYMFYSALGEGPESIGLATSVDGLNFEKYYAPLIAGRSPEVIDAYGKLFLFYVVKDGSEGYLIHMAASDDGKHFDPIIQTPVLEPGAPGEWDAFEVTTPRIFQRNDKYYMLYSGSSTPERKDMPQAFGLARSTDLLHWEKYPGNPVFYTGESGCWDDGAMWFGTVFEWDEALYLLYEGGRLNDLLENSPMLTQVGLAKLYVRDFDQAMTNWL